MTIEMKYYSGIGSRDTPPEVLEYMTQRARLFEDQGYTLRSGGAKGADRAFARGTQRRRIYRPDYVNQAAMDIAEKYHPNWKACSDYARRLHARNAFILLGRKLDTPSEFCMCWTPGGKVVGGTGQALRMCPDYGIEIINLGAARELTY